MPATKESNLDNILSKIADQPGPYLVAKALGAEPSLREIIECYYHIHGIDDYKKLTDRYIQEHSGEE